MVDNVFGMSKDSEAAYNFQFCRSEPRLRNAFGCTASRSVHRVSQCQNDISVFNSRDSTGGKLPHYGPRRAVFPPVHLCADFVTKSNSFSVTKSEILNYEIVCSLASSEWQA